MTRKKSTNSKSLILKYGGIFFVIYSLVWFVPGIVAYPVNSLLEYARAVEYVDGWTPGMMVWTIAVIVLPLLFFLGVAIALFKNKESEQ